MATIPLWGDGSKWGDGDKWGRQFGSTPHFAPVEHLPHRLSLQIAHTGSDFYIDRLSLTANLTSQIEERWQAPFAADTGERVSVQVAHDGSDFKVDSLRLVAQVRRKQPLG